MKTLWIALTIAAFIACAAVFQENAPVILNHIKGLGWLAPFLFLLLYGLATILLLPTMVLTLAGGALFGPVLCTLFNLVNYGLGMTRIKFSHYVITTFVFLAPAEIIYTYCGYAGMDALKNPAPFYKNASFVVLICLVALALILKFFNRKN